MNASTTENHSKLNQFLIYIAFHQFGQAKFAYCGSILSSSQFLLLLQLPQNLKLDTNIVKNSHCINVNQTCQTQTRGPHCFIQRQKFFQRTAVLKYYSYFIVHKPLDIKICAKIRLPILSNFEASLYKQWGRMRPAGRQFDIPETNCRRKK